MLQDKMIHVINRMNMIVVIVFMISISLNIGKCLGQSWRTNDRIETFRTRQRIENQLLCAEKDTSFELVTGKFLRQQYFQVTYLAFKLHNHSFTFIFLNIHRLCFYCAGFNIGHLSWNVPFGRMYQQMLQRYKMSGTQLRNRTLCFIFCLRRLQTR